MMQSCGSRFSSFFVVVSLFILFVASSEAKGATTHADRANNRRRGQCEDTECAHLHYLENTNCVNKCLSRSCFDEVYKGNELEDGELNQKLERSYKNCLRSETIRNRRSTK